MKLLQINTTVNSGSTGRIAEGIGRVAISAGHSGFIAAAYTNRPSENEVIPIGDALDLKLHGVKSRLLDRHGFGSSGATIELITKIEKLRPDIIHLHNLHGYYLHIGQLFNYLKTANTPVVWTLHDCWSFTGHCCFFDSVNCDKWKTQCGKCPLYNKYPKSLFVDNSANNYQHKRAIFNGVKNLTLVTPSYWLQHHVSNSFLNKYPVKVIHNGIDTQKFIPLAKDSLLLKQELNIPDKNIILGVASIWDKRKGLADFIKLSEIIADTEIIVLVGLTKEIIKTLPGNIIGIERTESVEELVAIYSLAMVFINPTWVDNFPTTNIEALSCGTPVITYNTGGSIEAVDEKTGFIVAKGNVTALKTAIDTIKSKAKSSYIDACRNRALLYFNDHERFADYLSLYEMVLQQQSTPVHS